MADRRFKLMITCAALVLCSACDPVYMIRQHYSATTPVGEDCVNAMVSDLKSLQPARRINVVRTPSARVDKVLVSDDYATVSWMLSEDRTAMTILYGTHGYASRQEIESAQSLILDMESRIANNCSAAEKMVLDDRQCTNIDC